MQLQIIFSDLYDFINNPLDRNYFQARIDMLDDLNDNVKAVGSAPRQHEQIWCTVSQQKSLHCTSLIDRASLHVFAMD
ncbi:MAG TPA: hypothetical protein DCM28_21675 [Phycisphaerales bacterium]|nr:hypothetical protein [Phycisphaerales bacterium]HCD35216.1 hypothetical protein [Phycisphaerales bacterium]